VAGDRDVVCGAVGPVAAAERLEQQVDNRRGDGDGGPALGCGAAARAPPTVARTAAVASHSLEWSAARESRRKTRSNVGVVVAATARWTARSRLSSCSHQPSGPAERSAPRRAGPARDRSVRDAALGDWLRLRSMMVPRSLVTGDQPLELPPAPEPESDPTSSHQITFDREVPSSSAPTRSSGWPASRSSPRLLPSANVSQWSPASPSPPVDPGLHQRGG
jgi:hypothetical protein